MEDIHENLNVVFEKFQNCSKTDIFNNSINAQTIKHHAIILKELIYKISENENFNKMLKSEDVKTYYEAKYFTALQALEKLENERESLRPEKKNSMSENDKTPRHRSEKKAKMNSKAKRMEAVLTEISTKKDLIDFEEAHFVAENEYRLILNEIKALEEEIVKMEFDKAQKCEKIKEMEKKCISIEAELKQFFDDNAKLRKQLDENNTQSVTFQLKKEEIENLLKKDSEKLSFAHHKNLYLQKINKELAQNFQNIQDEIKKTKEGNETMEKLCQDKIKEMDQINKDKRWSFLTRSNSFRASITPNKTNIIISDKSDNFFFKAKIATPDDSETERSFKESSNKIEIFDKTPKGLKKISCFEEEIRDHNNNTIVEIFPSHEKTMQSCEVLLTQSQTEVAKKKDRSCGCFEFSSILKIC